MTDKGEQTQTDSLCLLVDQRLKAFQIVAVHELDLDIESLEKDFELVNSQNDALLSSKNLLPQTPLG
jgi:hypothetical protein